MITVTRKPIPMNAFKVEKVDSRTIDQLKVWLGGEAEVAECIRPSSFSIQTRESFPYSVWVKHCEIHPESYIVKVPDMYDDITWKCYTVEEFEKFFDVCKETPEMTWDDILPLVERGHAAMRRDWNWGFLKMVNGKIILYPFLQEYYPTKEARDCNDWCLYKEPTSKGEE